ncbi:Cyclin-dependent kinase 15 [Dissostichus eleginoides]|uniref:mitogen-activated protein kinase n=1 Tax=Dissostichus eleginoides TaxID=100907 RepID=A0AAD9B2T3_DISEL|nr:Cyclin-dependent kinase 15 [Dissostichus eleginoides]
MSVFHDEVEIEDFEFDGETEMYYFPCPCGDRFCISKEDLENGEETATCPSCSLIVKVVYDQYGAFRCCWDSECSSDSTVRSGAAGTLSAPLTDGAFRCCWDSERSSDRTVRSGAAGTLSALTGTCADGPPPAFWFSTLQARPPRQQRGRRSSEGGDGEGDGVFPWNPGLRFGSSHSYLSLERLGGGASAAVYKGVSRYSSALKHANIVLLHDIIHTRETLTLVFEYMQTDLGQYLSEHPGGLNSHNVRLLLLQLLRGLLFLHSLKILHRDLKPQNLLLSFRGELKIADFGTNVVTLWYRPPDVLLGNTEYCSSLDMWSAGCIFVEMLQGAPAFPGDSDQSAQLQHIWTVLGVPSELSWPGVTQLPHFHPELFLPSQPKKLHNVWKRLQQLPGKTEDLLSQMLKLRPSERISAQDALKHHYFHTLPPPIMHLGDTTSIFKVPGVRLEAEVRAGRKLRPSVLHSATYW